jgi:hypothetical protein
MFVAVFGSYEFAFMSRRPLTLVVYKGPELENSGASTDGTVLSFLATELASILYIKLF